MFSTGCSYCQSCCQHPPIHSCRPDHPRLSHCPYLNILLLFHSILASLCLFLSLDTFPCISYFRFLYFHFSRILNLLVSAETQPMLHANFWYCLTNTKQNICMLSLQIGPHLERRRLFQGIWRNLVSFIVSNMLSLRTHYYSILYSEMKKILLFCCIDCSLLLWSYEKEHGLIMKLGLGLCVQAKLTLYFDLATEASIVVPRYTAV